MASAFHGTRRLIRPQRSHQPTLGQYPEPNESSPHSYFVLMPSHLRLALHYFTFWQPSAGPSGALWLIGNSKAAASANVGSGSPARHLVACETMEERLAFPGCPGQRNRLCLPLSLVWKTTDWQAVLLFLCVSTVREEKIRKPKAIRYRVCHERVCPQVSSTEQNSIKFSVEPYTRSVGRIC
jgi:hypothetical protein